MTDRIWLDWSKPILPAAASWLADRLTRGRECDAQASLCVVPGRRAGRLLRALLLEECRSRGLFLAPPRIVTPGLVVDVLFPPRAPLATPAEQGLAWMNILMEAEPQVMRALLPSPPEDSTLGAWQGLATRIAQVYEELAGSERPFGDAAHLAEALGADREADRWRALEILHVRYESLLQSCGLNDPPAARRLRLEAGDADPRIESVFLIGVIDLNAVQRRALERFPGAKAALIHAPEPLAERFDALGCVIPEAWSAGDIELDDDALVVCERLEDQAQAALHGLASWAEAYAAEAITIGLGDETLAPALERAGAWAGVRLRAATRGTLRHSGPWLLLQAAADWLDTERFTALAALVRHPDVEAWIAAGLREEDDRSGGVDDWAGLLDRYFSDCLSERMSAPWLGAAPQRRRLRAVHECVQSLLEPLRGPARRLGGWAGPMLEVLHRVYGSGESIAPAGKYYASASYHALREALGEFAITMPAIHPTCTATEAIQLFLRQVEALPLPNEYQPGAIEMLGWLELPADPAPALIITGFNDGAVPQSITADLFLPDGFRRQLGLMHNDQRLARDAYILEALLHSRERVTIISGRRGVLDEPLTPSRLLLRCDEIRLANRVREMSDPHPHRTRRWPIGIPIPVEAARSRFVVPKLPLPDPFTPPASMRVTDFRLYLQCPYRYALERILKLESVSDGAGEMDPLIFGGLAHQVLAELPQHASVCASENARAIESLLLGTLDRLASARFGLDPLTTVRVQLARLQQRLREFARFHAQSNADGWRLMHSELDLPAHSALDLLGQEPMPLRGKIDRIDRHEGTGRWRIIDYKTGEVGESPLKTHCDCNRIPKNGALNWIDLQLPLYHYLATRGSQGITGEIDLAYVVLPKAEGGVGLRPAPWTPQHLEDAVEKARQIVRDIRNRQFERNRDFVSSFDVFARLCQTRALTGDDEGDENSTEEE